MDLYSGSGGFSLGFSNISIAIIGIDIWLIALKTYHKNIKNGHPIQADVRHLPLRDTFDPDILIGSPPCQGFSGANIRGNRDLDPTLVNEFLKIRDLFNPTWWVMEESPFAAFLIPKKYLRFIKATDHGLYQVRNRMYAGNYPEIEPTRVTRKIHPSIRAREKKAFNKNMKRSKKAQSCCQWFGRRLTTWELQILMGFPPSYEFLGNYDERCIQIGNAVVPIISGVIANAIKTRKKPGKERGMLF